MKLKLLHKLFFTNLATVIPLLVALIFLHYESGQRFLNKLTQEVESPAMQSILSRLRIHYKNHRKWKISPDNDAEWNDILFKGFMDIYSPRDTDSYFSNFSKRIALADVNGELLTDSYMGDQDINRIPLKENGIIIGWLQVAKPRYPLAFLSAFNQAEINLVYWICALALTLTLIVNLLFARHLTSPISALQHTVKKLGQLRFDSETCIRNSDEIGSLNQTINQAAKELTAYQARQKRWLMDISHELRTPLTILIGEMEAITDGVSPCSRESVESLKEETQQIKRLVDDLHELTVMERVGFSLSQVMLEINEIILHQFSRYAEKLKNKNIHPELKIAEHPIVLFIDVNRIAQVIQNLLENCCRYVRAPGQVNFCVLADDQHCYISVDDSGPGVPDSALKYLFDPLYRADASRNRKTGGSGLGLAISKNIIAAHNGTITAERSVLGGLSIKITLPLQGE